MSTTIKNITFQDFILRGDLYSESTMDYIYDYFSLLEEKSKLLNGDIEKAGDIASLWSKYNLENNELLEIENSLKNIKSTNLEIEQLSSEIQDEETKKDYLKKHADNQVIIDNLQIQLNEKRQKIANSQISIIADLKEKDLLSAINQKPNYQDLKEIDKEIRKTRNSILENAFKALKVDKTFEEATDSNSENCLTAKDKDNIIYLIISEDENRIDTSPFRQFIGELTG